MVLIQRNTACLNVHHFYPGYWTFYKSVLGLLIAEEGQRRLLYFFVLSYSMLVEDEHFKVKFWIVQEKIQNVVIVQWITYYCYYYFNCFFVCVFVFCGVGWVGG